MSTNFPILDLVIGLFFIFFLLSIVTSSAVEVVLTIGRARSRILENWLRGIFNQSALDTTGKPLPDTTVGQAIMDHCMTTVRTGTNKATPYISSANFVTAMLDKVTITPADGDAFQPPPNGLPAYMAAIKNSPLISNELKRIFLAFGQEASATAEALRTSAGPVTSQLLTEVKTEMDLFRTRLEDWFDDTRDRFTDTLKRGWTVWLTALFGAVIVVSANADTVRIARYLYAHKAESKRFADSAIAHYTRYEGSVQRLERNVIAADTSVDSTATQASKDSAGVAAIHGSIDSLKQDMASLKNEIPSGIPMGWDDETYPQKNWPEKIGAAVKRHALGWLVSILAVMLGAPFWFDSLNKLANVRGAGPKPASNAESERKSGGE